MRLTIPSNSTKLKWNDSNESSQNWNELPKVLNVNAELLFYYYKFDEKNCQLICSWVMCESNLSIERYLHITALAWLLYINFRPSATSARVNAKRMLFIQEVNEKWCDSSKEARPIQVRTLRTKVTFKRKRHCITVSTQKESFHRLVVGLMCCDTVCDAPNIYANHCSTTSLILLFNLLSWFQWFCSHSHQVW